MTASHLASLPPLEFALDDNVCYLLARARSTIVNTVNQDTTAELGVTSVQANILFMLATGRCVVAAQLAREAGIDASAITRQIDRLARRGLLSRLRSEEDRRIVRLSLTPQGRQLAEQIPAIYLRVLERVLRNFTPEEAGFLKNMLRRVIENIGMATEPTESKVSKASAA
jgi:DNA-binding MarR family transcriptional regulator